MAYFEAKCAKFDFRVGHGLDPSMDWIGLDWVRIFRKLYGLDWIGLDPITAIPCFFIYKISILTTDKR